MSSEHKPQQAPQVWICSECGSQDLTFDRSLCACGAMHYYCGGCGRQDDDCDPPAPKQHSDREAHVIDAILFVLFYVGPTILAIVSIGWWVLRG